MFSGLVFNYGSERFQRRYFYYLFFQKGRVGKKNKELFKSWRSRGRGRRVIGFLRVRDLVFRGFCWWLVCGVYRRGEVFFSYSFLVRSQFIVMLFLYLRGLWGWELQVVVYFIFVQRLYFRMMWQLLLFSVVKEKYWVFYRKKGIMSWFWQLQKARFQGISRSFVVSICRD